MPISSSPDFPIKCLFSHSNNEIYFFYKLGFMYTVKIKESNGFFIENDSKKDSEFLLEEELNA